MASLWKHPNSPFWTACYVGADGRREKRSTKFRDRNAALKTALEWEKLAKSGRENRLTEVQARRVVSDIVATVTGNHLHFHSTRHWLDEWLAGKTGTTSDGTLTRYRHVIADFVAFLGDRAELPLPSISPADVRSYRDKLAREGRAPSTVNLQIKKVLNVPFSSAQKLGYIPLNPYGAVEALRSRASEREIFTPDQVRDIVAAAEGDWRGVVLCGYYTGLRLGDVCGLRWESVDLDAGVFSRADDQDRRPHRRARPSRTRKLAPLAMSRHRQGIRPSLPRRETNRGRGWIERAFCQADQTRGYRAEDSAQTPRRGSRDGESFLSQFPSHLRLGAR